MTTAWTLPTLITQYSEIGAETFHIDWVDVFDFAGLKSLDQESVKTTRDLIHIARDPKHDILQKTYFLKLTGFNFTDVTESVNGIEMKLTMNRGGRITDDTVQLCLRDSLIGKNMASLTLDPIKLYGSNDNIWETSLSIEDIQDPTFGITLRFQSHPRWPHRSSPLIDAVELRIH